MDDAELRRLAEELAERVTSNILRLENVTLQEGGCEHTSDDDDGTCWHCREERYERVVLSAAPPFLRRVAEEARRQERLRIVEEITGEAAHVPMGEAFEGGPLHGTSVFNVLMWAHRRIKGEER